MVFGLCCWFCCFLWFPVFAWSVCFSNWAITHASLFGKTVTPERLAELFFFLWGYNFGQITITRCFQSEEYVCVRGGGICAYLCVLFCFETIVVLHGSNIVIYLLLRGHQGMPFASAFVCPVAVLKFIFCRRQMFWYMSVFDQNSAWKLVNNPV